MTDKEFELFQAAAREPSGTWTNRAQDLAMAAEALLYGQPSGRDLEAALEDYLKTLTRGKRAKPYRPAAQLLLALLIIETMPTTLRGEPRRYEGGLAVSSRDEIQQLIANATGQPLTMGQWQLAVSVLYTRLETMFGWNGKREMLLMMPPTWWFWHQLGLYGTPD